MTMVIIIVVVVVGSLLRTYPRVNQGLPLSKNFLVERLEMKFTMFVASDAMQFNLEPETETEKELLKLLNKYKGEVTIHNGVSIAESQGGFIRNYGETERVLAITIRKPAVDS